MTQSSRQLINTHYFWKIRKEYKLTNKLSQLFRKYATEQQNKPKQSNQQQQQKANITT